MKLDMHIQESKLRAVKEEDDETMAELIEHQRQK
jgi:hypothetical protein